MAIKEIANRFDFKGTVSEISLNEEALEIDLSGESDLGVRNILTVLESKFVKRNLDRGFFDAQKIEDGPGGKLKQKIIIKKGINTEKAKEICKFIKDSKLKVKTQIQDEKIRVASSDKDTLQKTIQTVKANDFGLVLLFNNYR